jgi:hypothetical protein
LKDSLPEIAGEEEGVRPMRAKRREESQMGDADVLRLIHYRKVEGRCLA